MGRKKLPASEIAVPVRLPRRIVDLLDAYVSERLIVDEQRVPFSGDSKPTPHEVAAARRRYLSELIEKHLGFEAQFATGVSIVAPASGTGPELREAANWLEEQEERLVEDAPLAIRRAVAENKDFLSDLEDSPPEVREATKAFLNRRRRPMS